MLGRENPEMMDNSQVLSSTTRESTAATEPLVALRGVTKAFPNVVANDKVDLDIYNAEIHALLGENGAGKSTLMKILYGFYRADAGLILHRGEPYAIRSPQDARAIHIGMVFQDLNLIPALSVAENIALFLPDLPAILKAKEIAARISAISKRYNLQVDPHALVSHLSIGEQQKVEILKLLLSDARLLILDEPTRVLAPHEVDALFSVLDRLREDGYAIILITHKMKEVLACADRITVLRKGRVAGSLLRSEAYENALVELMFAKKISALQVSHKAQHAQAGKPLLELRSAGTRGEGAETSLKDIDLQIYPGEIVGVAGVSGNGQKELGDLVLGMIDCTSGVKLLNGEDMTHLSIQQARKGGVVFIPEDPLAMALVPYMSVLENFSLTNIWRYARHAGLSMDWQSAKIDAQSTLANLGFDVPLYVPAKALSGGNLQRMVIAREMSHQPRLIVASYLTRGLDVQSTLAARKALLQARDEGAGVLLISEDLEELFQLSDRLIVLYQGKIVGTYTPAGTDVYEIGHLMTGSEVNYAPQG
jgi:simple sugar transport system ATP-binding protein